ncbi:MAG: hypothetical protein QOG53_2326 [Frankiales bacterium]|jgi:hypothetical protein|nr:hypothetical protein [Frankiales bacterium]
MGGSAEGQPAFGWRVPAVINVLCLITALLVAVTTRSSARADVEPNDEIHSGYGDSAATSMWVFWHGPDSTIDYGQTNAYGATATASLSPITPVDIAGPFYRVQLTGLTAGTVYHYKIGASGLDHTFKTAPVGSFTWTDIGDTGTSFYDPAAPAKCNKTWMPEVWQQITAENSDLITHGGDISYANDCGVGAVHQFWNDIEPIATQRPMEFALGNHEYGTTESTAPPGTPQDRNANYKGRFYIPNPRTTPADTATTTAHPGCPPASGTTGNGCRGADWGYFQVGHALFISYPEPDNNGFVDWQAKADALMAGAETDANISFIVTYGHRPPYSSASTQTAPKLQTAINALGDKYSPSARADGKYLLNVGHHVHGGEVISPQHGVLQVTNGGGGAENFGFSNTDPNSLWKTGHFEHLRVTVTGPTMKLDFICGPVYTLSPNKEPCVKDSVIYSTTLTSPVVPPPDPDPTPTPTPTPSPTVSPTPPPGPTEYVLNRSVENGDKTGWLGLYNAKSRVTAMQPAGGAYDGTWALQITNTNTAAQSAGVANAQPFWVTNTTAGKPYTGSAWVSGPAGTVVNLMLRECTSGGSCSSYKTKPVTLGSGWTQVVTTFTPAASGNEIRFYLYASSIGAGQSFFADSFSETAP